MDRAGLTALTNAVRDKCGCDATWADGTLVSIGTTPGFVVRPRKGLLKLRAVSAAWQRLKMALKPRTKINWLWRGEVQTFDLVGHSSAKHAFAWSELDENAVRKIFVVLEDGKVTDAPSAVHSSLELDREQG